MLQHFLQQASEGNFQLKVEQTGIEELRRELRAGARRRDSTLVAAATLLGGIVWLAVGAAPVAGIVLLGAGLLGIVLARTGD